MWPPLAVNGALRGSNGKEVETQSLLRPIPDVGSEGRFDSLLWYKQRGAELLTSLFRSSASLDGNHPSPPLILKLAMLHCLRWLVGVIAADAPAVGVSVVIAARRCPVVQRRALPLVWHCRRPGESSSCVDAHLGLVLTRDAGICLLIGIGPRLLVLR
jgi:hypothetical protein